MVLQPAKDKAELQAKIKITIKDTMILDISFFPVFNFLISVFLTCDLKSVLDNDIEFKKLVFFF